MTRTLQQQIAAQRRVVARTPPLPLLAYHAARDRLAALEAELRAAEEPGGTPPASYPFCRRDPCPHWRGYCRKDPACND